MTDETRSPVIEPHGVPAAGAMEESYPAAGAASSWSFDRDDVHVAADVRGQAGRGRLSPERTAQIRQKILQGAYDTTEVLEVVARRLLDSGDLHRGT